MGEALREGQTVQAKVLEVDAERKRISLSIKQLVSQADFTGPAPAAVESGAPEELPPPPKKRKTPLKGGLD